jgi:tetratricopeptide (TPR) repeat protein
VEFNPKYSYAYNNLGNIYKAKEEYEKALFYYRQAVEHLSTYTLAFVNMGVCYERL